MDSARGKVWKIAAAYDELDALKLEYPVISVIPSVDGYELRLVADTINRKNTTSMDPNLEDAYVYFMQTLDYDET